MTGEPIPNTAYRIKFSNGEYAYGTTDEMGRTSIVGGDKAEALVIEVQA